MKFLATQLPRRKETKQCTYISYFIQKPPKFIKRNVLHDSNIQKNMESTEIKASQKQFLSRFTPMGNMFTNAPRKVE